MGFVKRFRELPTSLMILHVASKVIVSFGLGIVLAKQLGDLGGWIIILGIVLSIPSAYRILSGK